jgi:hypothetical protein
MIERAKENWRRFKRSKPGRRFREHHHRYQQGCIGRSYLRRFFGIIGGFWVVVVGLITVPGPGPGWLVILLGFGIIAGESLLFARMLDRIEVELRRSSRWIVGIWRASPGFVKASIVIAIVACATAVGIGIVF